MAIHSYLFRSPEAPDQIPWCFKSSLPGTVCMVCNRLPCDWVLPSCSQCLGVLPLVQSSPKLLCIRVVLYVKINKRIACTLWVVINKFVVLDWTQWMYHYQVAFFMICKFIGLWSADNFSVFSTSISSIQWWILHFLDYGTRAQQTEIFTTTVTTKLLYV